jgi:FixJ family two-component response regulator
MRAFDESAYNDERSRPKGSQAMTTVTRTVFIVDDAMQVRKSLSRLLTAVGYQVRAFESAESFLGEQYTDVPGCLLLDICLPGLSGIQLQRSLAKSLNTLPIVFLTGKGDIQTSVNAMKEGAVDFLTKPIDSVRLFAAVERAFQRDELQRLRVSVRQMVHQRFDQLTPRERQVMVGVISGRLNKQIAVELGTGEKTVKVHRARVMSKMLARSVPELVQLGARVGVEIQPALAIGSMALSWKRPDVQPAKRLEYRAPGARLADRMGREEVVLQSRELEETSI